MFVSCRKFTVSIWAMKRIYQSRPWNLYTALFLVKFSMYSVINLKQKTPDNNRDFQKDSISNLFFCHATMTSGSTPVTALFSLSRVRPWELRIFRKARRPCCNETSKFTRVLWQGSLLTNLEPNHGKPGAWVKVAVGWGFEGKISYLPLTGLLELGVCLKFIS